MLELKVNKRNFRFLPKHHNSDYKTAFQEAKGLFPKAQGDQTIGASVLRIFHDDEREAEAKQVEGIGWQIIRSDPGGESQGEPKDLLP